MCIITEKSIKAEREPTDDKIRAVIGGFASKFDNLINSIDTENHSLTQKIGNLELRLDTVTSYLEQALYKYRAEISKHCINCEENFRDRTEQLGHQVPNHRSIPSDEPLMQPIGPPSPKLL